MRVDPSQIQQILWNLCQNALTHGRAAGNSAPVQIRYGRLAINGRPYLEVADQGPGISLEDSERVFEPFFTRAPSGTGLGLFLARELAQANRATLLHESSPRRRDDFPHSVLGSGALGNIIPHQHGQCQRTDRRR